MKEMILHDKIIQYFMIMEYITEIASVRDTGKSIHGTYKGKNKFT